MCFETIYSFCSLTIDAWVISRAQWKIPCNIENVFHFVEWKTRSDVDKSAGVEWKRILSRLLSLRSFHIFFVLFNNRKGKILFTASVFLFTVEQTPNQREYDSKLADFCGFMDFSEKSFMLEEKNSATKFISMAKLSMLEIILSLFFPS